MYLTHAIAVRKLIHFFTGILILVLSFIVAKDILLWLIIAGSLFSFLTFRYKRFYMLHKTTYKSLGTLFYPLGVFSSYLLLYTYPLFYFQTALLTLTVSDTLANLIGHIKMGNGWFRVLWERKSMHGIAGYVVSTLLILYLLLPVELKSNPSYLFFLIMLAVVLEVFSWRGSDNFTIPFGLSVFFWLSENYLMNYSYLAGVFLFMGMGGVLLYRLKILTQGGSIAAWLLGNYLLMALGVVWIVPVLVFFISSVIFTKIYAALKHKSKKSNRRNAWQVVANILWAVASSVLWLFTHNDTFIYLYIVYVAAVTSDTWASEAGPVFNSKSFCLSDMRMHEAGVTGGISFAGTLAALCGAAILSALSLLLFFGEINSLILLYLTLSAFFACFADTLLGAFVEGKLLKMPFFKKRNNTESITPNDMVNLAGSLTAGIFLILLLSL